MSLRRPNGFISAGYDPLKTPNAPTIGVATSAGPTAVSVTFTAPSNVGGGAITGYVATAKKTSDGTTTSGVGTSSPLTISGLTTNEAYTVTVAAVNAFGLGPSSAASNSVTPMEMQLWSWGRNDEGQLGQNNLVNRSSPVQVGALATWNRVSAVSKSAFAIKTDGTLWAWGENNSGQLGFNDTVSRSSPVQVGALTNWSKLTSAASCTFAIKTDGTLWAWGNNSTGKLGLNDTVNRSSPVQVGALTNWVEVGAMNTASVAINSEGKLYTWGWSLSGQLGQNDLISRSSPTQVGALTNWAKAQGGLGSHLLAVKTDGTLWSWGSGEHGKLGSNATTNRSSPVQVGALTNWRNITTRGQGSAAVKVDNTLWTWGRDNDGECGQGTNFQNLSSPAQVGALSNWANVYGNWQQAWSFATKTDGTLWAWGNNYYGQLGQNNTTNRSSPVQVGALTKWASVAVGQVTLAIKTS
jgi:alpha-tubulin suppressor-like RCC1 family protein